MSEPSPSFEDVYRAHFSYVWRSLRRLGVRDVDAADAAQDVFLVVHRRLAEFEGRAKMTTWLFRICMHVASDRLRKAHVRREIVGGTDFDALAHSASSAEQASEAARQLERGLSALDIDERAVFVLFEVEGLGSAEIARELRIPLGTVYSRLRRARGVFLSTFDPPLTGTPAPSEREQVS